MIRSWFKRKIDPEYELLWHMTRLQELITDLQRQIRATRKSPLQPYWERKWEEAVMLYMDFEWHFHPANYEGFKR